MSPQDSMPMGGRVKSQLAFRSSPDQESPPARRQNRLEISYEAPQIGEVIFSFWQAVGVFAGLICILVGTVWWTVAAFRRSLWWGIACFFFLIPVGLVFAIRDWRLARWGVGLTVLGCALILPGLAAVWVHWPEIEELAREVKADLFPGF